MHDRCLKGKGNSIQFACVKMQEIPEFPVHFLLHYDRAQFQVPDRTDFRYLKFHLPNCISCIHVTSNKSHVSSSFHVPKVKFPVFMSETEIPCVIFVSWSEHQISYILDKVRKLHVLSNFQVLKISDFWLDKCWEKFF